MSAWASTGNPVPWAAVTTAWTTAGDGTGPAPGRVQAELDQVGAVGGQPLHHPARLRRRADEFGATAGPAVGLVSLGLISAGPLTATTGQPAGGG